MRGTRYRPLDDAHNVSVPKFVHAWGKDQDVSADGGYCYKGRLPPIHGIGSNESYAVLTPCGRSASCDGNKSIYDFSPRPTELMNVEGNSFISQPSILSKLDGPQQLNSSNISVLIYQK